jgi:chromosome segregation ATPase
MSRLAYNVNREDEHQMRKIILAGLVAVVAVTATAVPAQAATSKERTLARQVKTLKAQAAKLKRERNAARVQLAGANARLATTQASLVMVTGERDAARGQVSAVTGERDAARGQVSAVTGERDAARANLGVCQQGVAAAASTMTPMQLTTDLLPTLHAVFEGWKEGYGAGQVSAYAYKSSTVTDSYRSQGYSFDVTEWLQ